MAQVSGPCLEVFPLEANKAERRLVNRDQPSFMLVRLRASDTAGMYKTAALVVVVACYAWVASGVRTFTAPAATFTGIALFALVALLFFQARLGDRAPAFLRRGHRVVSLGSRRTGLASAQSARRGALAWGAAFFAIVGFELVNFFQLPRQVHPTLSSLINGFTQDHWSKALLYAGWLVLGAYLSRR